MTITYKGHMMQGRPDEIVKFLQIIEEEKNKTEESASDDCSDNTD